MGQGLAAAWWGLLLLHMLDDHFLQSQKTLVAASQDP